MHTKYTSLFPNPFQSLVFYLIYFLLKTLQNLTISFALEPTQLEWKKFFVEDFCIATLNLLFLNTWEAD